MKPETFKENPYGNFVYISSSKLLYYTIKQTLKRQQNSFLNETAFDIQDIMSQ